MRGLLFIFSFFTLVYGEAPADPGYSYPVPNNYPPPPPASSEDTSHSQETPIEDINRYVYFFKSPTDARKLPPSRQVKPPPLKKNYKIIFIKAPEAPVPQIPPLPPPRNEEKTIVYVLSKKPEEQAEVILPKPASTKPPAPEVYFINYGIKKDGGVEEKGGQDSSPIDTTPEPVSKPLVIPSEYLPPQKLAVSEFSSQEIQPQLPTPKEPTPNLTPKENPPKPTVLEPHEEKPEPSLSGQYGPPSGGQVSSNTVQTEAYSSSVLSEQTQGKSSSDSSSQYELGYGPPKYPGPVRETPNGEGSQKQQTSSASEIASQYGPPKQNDILPPKTSTVYLPPKTSYEMPAPFDSSGRYLPPKTSYGVPDPSIRLSRAGRYSPSRTARRVFEDSDVSMDIVKGVYEYYGP